MDKLIHVGKLWKRMPGQNNMILEDGDLMISYNPIAGASVAADVDGLGMLAQMMGGTINGEIDPQEETAFHDGKVWRILKGDFRKEYEMAFPDLDKCLAVYDKYKSEYRSGWSTD